MKHIISFLLLISLLGCGSGVSKSTYEMADRNKAELLQSKSGYDFCADYGAYYYAVLDVEEYSWWYGNRETGEATNGCFATEDSRVEMVTRDRSYSFAYAEKFKTRLADELDPKISKLSNEFMCISLNEDDNDEYTENSYKNELNSRLVNENDIQASNEEDVLYGGFITSSAKKEYPSELCDEIYEDYVFANLIEKQQSKCMKMGFSLETNEMSNCVLQLISSEQKATTTTVVVDGGSSGSSDAVADELRKMNKRQSLDYYNKMMKTGYDMMTCYTWPNC